MQKWQTDGWGSGVICIFPNERIGPPFLHTDTLNQYRTKWGSKSIWYRLNAVSSGENQHVQIVAFGKWRTDSFMRWQLKRKKRFLQIGPTMNKTHKFAWSSWSITRRLSPSGRIYCRVLKRTRWWGRRCFQPWGFQYFLRGWEERSRAADVLSCSAAPRANLRCSQSGLTTNWRWLCKGWPHGSKLCRFPLFTDPRGLATAADFK